MNQELINRAHELRDHGFTTGEIADELNVSMETARWLSLQRPEEKTVEQAPADIAINWEKVGGSSQRLSFSIFVIEALPFSSYSTFAFGLLRYSLTAFCISL